jgi:hypothetical protein
LKKGYKKYLKETSYCRNRGTGLTQVGVDVAIGYKEIQTGKEKKLLKYLVFIELNDTPTLGKIKKLGLLEEYSERVAEDLYNLVK